MTLPTLNYPEYAGRYPRIVETVGTTWFRRQIELYNEARNETRPRSVADLINETSGRPRFAKLNCMLMGLMAVHHSSRHKRNYSSWIPYMEAVLHELKLSSGREILRAAKDGLRNEDEFNQVMGELHVARRLTKVGNQLSVHNPTDDTRPMGSNYDVRVTLPGGDARQVRGDVKWHTEEIYRNRSSTLLRNLNQIARVPGTCHVGLARYVGPYPDDCIALALVVEDLAEKAVNLSRTSDLSRARSDELEIQKDGPKLFVKVLRPTLVLSLLIFPNRAHRIVSIMDRGGWEQLYGQGAPESSAIGSLLDSAAKQLRAPDRDAAYNVGFVGAAVFDESGEAAELAALGDPTVDRRTGIETRIGGRFTSEEYRDAFRHVAGVLFFSVIPSEGTDGNHPHGIKSVARFIANPNATQALPNLLETQLTQAIESAWTLRSGWQS